MASSKVVAVVAVVLVLVVVGASIGLVWQTAPTPTSVRAFSRDASNYEFAETLHAATYGSAFTVTTTTIQTTGVSAVLTGTAPNPYEIEWYIDCDVPGLGYVTRANGGGTTSLTSTPQWYTFPSWGQYGIQNPWTCRVRWIERSGGHDPYLSDWAKWRCDDYYGPCSDNSNPLVVWGEPIPPNEPEPDPDVPPDDALTNYTNAPPTDDPVLTEGPDGGPPEPKGSVDAVKVAEIAAVLVLALVVLVLLARRRMRRGPS